MKKTGLWAGDKAYSDLMRELWGSPGLWNERKTYVEVAKKLGVDEETVRNRLKYMKESGFLLGWRVVPSPTMLGRRPTLLLLETDEEEGSSKDEIVSKLKKLDGVITIISIYSNNLIVNLFDHENESLTKQISAMPGITMRPLTVPRMNLPQTIFRMTPTDWRIVSLLLRDAERKLADVAKEVKVSAKTVKRRLNAMMAGSAILIMPMVNLKKTSGVSYSLMIQSEEAKRAEVEKLVASKISNLVFRAQSSKNGSIFGFTGANVVEGNEMVKWVKQLDGVKTARIYISEEVLQVFDWLEKEVESRSMVAKT